MTMKHNSLGTPNPFTMAVIAMAIASCISCRPQNDNKPQSQAAIECIATDVFVSSTEEINVSEANGRTIIAFEYVYPGTDIFDAIDAASDKATLLTLYSFINACYQSQLQLRPLFRQLENTGRMSAVVMESMTPPLRETMRDGLSTANPLSTAIAKQERRRANLLSEESKDLEDDLGYLREKCRVTLLLCSIGPFDSALNQKSGGSEIPAISAGDFEAIETDASALHILSRARNYSNIVVVFASPKAVKELVTAAKKKPLTEEGILTIRVSAMEFFDE